MIAIKKGVYELACGHKAVVGTIRNYEGNWIAQGAIISSENPKIRFIHSWTMQGKSLMPADTARQWDIVKEAEQHERADQECGPQVL